MLYYIFILNFDKFSNLCGIFCCQVRIVLEGVDKFNNLIASVYYPDGDTAKDLALELVQNV